MEAIIPVEMQPTCDGVQHHACINCLAFGLQFSCGQQLLNVLYTFSKFWSLLLSLESISFLETLMFWLALIFELEN